MNASARLSPATYQALALGMPLAAIALSLFIVIPTLLRYRSLQAEVARKRGELQALRSAPLPPQDATLTAAADVEAEPADFLNGFTTLVRSSGCEVTGMDVADGSSSGPVRALRTKVTVTGYFGRLRSLFWRLYRARRLYAVADLNLTGSSGNRPQGELGAQPLTASFTLERYVTSETGAPAAASAADLP